MGGSRYQKHPSINMVPNSFRGVVLDTRRLIPTMAFSAQRLINYCTRTLASMQLDVSNVVDNILYNNLNNSSMQRVNLPTLSSSA